jgi:peroxiredoxin
MRTDIIEGATLPDYELPDHTNTRRKLSLLQGNDPMILMLGRGFYCPKDRQQLHELVRFSKQCAVGFTRLVTITTDSFVQLNDLRLGVGADWPFLYDEQRVIQRDLDIQEYTDPHNNPMIPHTFVLEPGLKIYKIYNGYWYWGAADDERVAPGPPRDHTPDSRRLADRHARAACEVGRWRAQSLLSLWEILEAGIYPHGRRGRSIRAAG